MINIDKDYLITVDLKNTKVKSDKTIFFYNTDLNICNIFIKLICTDEDKTIPEDLIVEFAVLKPETDEFKPLDATLISKEDLLYQVDLTTDYFDIVGKYSCEIRVSGTIENELKCFTSEEFDYVVKPNITAKLDKKIKNDKNLPVLEKLIKDVKEITDGINKNEIQMKRDENLVGDNKTIVGAINQLREDVNSGIGGGTVELKDYQKKNDEFLNTDEKTITGGINEVNNKIKKVQESQIELDKDDVSFNGIDDISHDELNTTNKTLIGAINEVNTQCKDIANLGLTKHTDGKVYIKKQDGTLLGTGIEIGGSDVDLSKITMSMTGQTLKLMNDGTQISTVEIPTAVVTDEQLTSIIQSKIDDGTLASLALGDNSVATNNIQDEAITESKVSFMNKTAHEEVVNNYDSNKTNWGKTCSNGVDLTDYSSTDFGLTDYIEIIPNTEITINYVQKGLSDKVWYYDKNKSLLGNITINSTTNTDIVITVTDTSAKYIRFMAKKDATKSVNLSNITYTYKLKKDLLEKGIESNIETMVSIDAYNADTCVDGLLGDNGTITNMSGFKVTDYVEIIPNTEIITAWGETGWPCGICYYDENKQFLGSMKNTQQGSNTFIITDENAKYIRYSVQTIKTQYLIVKINIHSLISNKFNKFIPKSYDGTVNDVTCLTGQGTKQLIDNLDFNRSKWKGKKIIVDGDSITHYGTWHTWLKKWFEWNTVYSHACSGNTLTLARVGNDASGVGKGLKGYERVQQNYESDADAIILMGDGNDYGTVGTYSDTTEDTWCGRMNLMLDAIETKYPTKPIILISIPPRKNTSSYQLSGLGGLYDNQAKAMRDLAYNRNYYYIDCYHINLYRPNNTQNVALFGNNGNDTTHPNDLGHKMMAQMIYEDLKKVGIDF